MKLELKPFDFASAVAKAGLRTDGTPLKPVQPPDLRSLESTGGASAVEPGDFRSAMAQALKSVSRAQFESARLQQEVQMDNPTVSLEETMIAMQTSQIGFQSVLAVRNRLVQAYSDIMNMQV